MVHPWSAVSDGWCLIFMVLLTAGTSFSGLMADLDFPCHEVYITGWVSTRPSWSSWALAEVVTSSWPSMVVDCIDLCVISATVLTAGWLHIHPGYIVILCLAHPTPLDGSWN